MKNNWPFSELGWWINAIYHYSGFNPPAGTEDVIDASVSPYRKLETLNKCFEAQVMSLSQTDMAETQARSTLFAAKCLRKWRFTESESSRAIRARDAQLGFLQRNSRAEHTSFYGCDPTIRWLMRHELVRMLPEINQDGIHGRFGPGAVAERYTHPVRYAHLGEWFSRPDPTNNPFGHRDMDHVTARLCAVPKQYDKDRLITVEPCYASFVQQYVRRVLLESIHAGVLRHTCMDLGYTDGQAIQRRLAQKASEDRSLATLDLKDASDNITWDVVQDVFPIWVVDLLNIARSTWISANVCGEDQIDGRIYTRRLSIYAGMGNATTFVVETLFFTAYVKAVARMCGLKRPQVSVFGDDVICSTDTAMSLLNYESSYFIINRTKSFYRSTDRLRESCGIFAYNGKDITVPRIDGYSNDYAGRLGLVDLVNRLVVLGEKKDMRFSALAYLIVEVGRQYGIPNFPRLAVGYPSFHSWYNSYDAVPKVRRNHSTGDIEYKLPVREARTTLVSTSRNDYLSHGLYLGWFLGQIRTVQHRGVPYVPFPNGKWRMKTRWVRTERGFDTDHAVPAQASTGPLYGDTGGTLPPCWCPYVQAPMQV